MGRINEMRKQFVLGLFLVTLIALVGCGNSKDIKSIKGLFYIGYSDIDTVCENPELAKEGEDLLTAQSDNMVLCLVIDSEILLEDEELKPYDHLIISNIAWVKEYGDIEKLKSIDFQSLSPEMQKFFEDQIPLWTKDGSTLPDGMSLYEYENGELMALPQYAALGEKPIYAKNPLIIMIDNPTDVLRADSFLLPLTSGGNILFINGESLSDCFDKSALKNYGNVDVVE